MAQNESLDIIELESNLADVEKPPEIPPGLYLGEIQDIQKADSAKGNQYFAIKFVIAPDELPADMQDQFEDGAVLYWNRQIVPTLKDRRALFNLRKFIEAIGLDANTTSIDPNEWMGQTARLRVRHGKFNGEFRAEIQSVEPAEAAATARGRGRAPEPEVEEDDTPPARPGRATTRAPARAAAGRRK